MAANDELIEAPRTDQEKRELALRRLRAKRDFWTHLFTYLTVNAMLVVIWLFTTGGQFRGFFWPIFVIAGWGVGLVIHGYVAFRGNIVTEEQIQREMRNLPG